MAWSQILLIFCHPFSTCHSVNLHDVEKKEALQQSQDECVSVPSTVQEDSACNQPYRDAKSAYEEEKVGFALDGACGCSQAKEDEIDLSGSLHYLC